MSRIPEHLIDQVRQAHDIAEVIGRYLELKRAGRALKALCPFHEEKTASFTVNADRQTYKCFGCGKGGNVFGFLMEHQGLTFPEAVRSLAQERGIEIPRVAGGDPDDGDRLRAVRQALSFARTFFVERLHAEEGAEARRYLHQRGYDDAAIERFRLGYAPAAWDRLLQGGARAGIPSETLLAAGLVQRRREGDGFYDRFRNRIVFPIADVQERVVTFGARALGDDDPSQGHGPKYLNGPETIVFKKSNLLYGLDLAREGMRKTGEALLMEGYTDVLMAHLHGFDRAVAGMGTAFTERQAHLLRRFVSRVVLVYDSDSAGRVAAERALDVLLAEGLEVRIALLPEGRDVDEILLEDGAEAFAAVLAGARELFEFKLGLLADRHDLGAPRGRAEAIEALVPTLARVKSPIEQNELVRMVAERLGGRGTERLLRRAMAADGLGPARRPDPTAAASDPASDRVQRLRARTRSRDELRLLAAVVNHPELRDEVFRAVGPEDFTVPVLARLYKAVLDLEEGGATYDLHTLIARAEGDAETAAALADLPDEANLDDNLRRQLAFLEGQRRQERLRRSLAELPGRLAREASERAVAPADGTWNVLASEHVEKPLSRAEVPLDLQPPDRVEPTE